MRAVDVQKALQGAEAGHVTAAGADQLHRVPTVGGGRGQGDARRDARGLEQIDQVLGGDVAHLGGADRHGDAAADPCRGTVEAARAGFVARERVAQRGPGERMQVQPEEQLRPAVEDC